MVSADRLAVLAEHVGLKASVYLRPSWKMWPISMPRAMASVPGAVGRRVAVAHLGGLDGAVDVKSRPATEADDMLAGFVGAGHPGGAVDDPRVDQVANPLASSRPSGRCSRFTRNGCLPKSVVLEHLDLAGGDRGLQALVVHLAVAGQADAQELPLLHAGVADLDHDVLQRVRGRNLDPVAVHPVDQRRRWSGCRGCPSTWARAAAEAGLRARRWLDGLDVGGVAGFVARHVRVLADRALGEELLGRRAAHRAGHRERSRT